MRIRINMPSSPAAFLNAFHCFVPTHAAGKMNRNTVNETE